MANYYYLVQETFTSANPSLAAGVIALPGVYDANIGTTKTAYLEYNAIKKASVASFATATASVVTATVSGTIAAGNTLSFQLTQDLSALNNNLPDTYSALISYTCKVGDTATTVGNALALMINAMPFEATAVNVTGTVTITASTAHPIMNGAEVQDDGANLAVSTSLGAKAVGQGDDLIAAGIVEAVSGQEYDVYTLYVKTFKPAGLTGDVSERLDVVTLYIGDAAGVTNAYDTTLDTILNGGSTTANYLDVLR